MQKSDSLIGSLFRKLGRNHSTETDIELGQFESIPLVDSESIETESSTEESAPAQDKKPHPYPMLRSMFERLGMVSPGERDIELGLPETSVITGGSTATKIASVEKEGFEIGDFDRNLKYAQRILDDSSSSRLIWTRAQPLLKQAVIDTGVSATKILLTYKLSELLLNQSQSNGLADMIQMQGISNAVQDGTTTLGGLAKIVMFAPEGDELAAATMKIAIARADQELQPLLDSIPPLAREGIQKTIDELITRVNNFKIGNPYNPKAEELKKRWRHIVDIISLPLKTSNTYQHDLGGDPAKGEALDQAQRKIADSFGDELSNKLYDFMTTHRFAGVDPHGRQPFHIFEGPPAVGKTWSIRQMKKEPFNTVVIEATEGDLADFLGVPLMGQKEPNKTFDWDLWKLIEPEGKIWHILRTAPKDSNIVLLVDEISFKKHPELIDPIKRWMTGKHPIFPNSKEIPGCPEFTVVLASNEEIYNQLDAAAKSRVTHYIQFPNWTRELLEKRVYEYVDSKMAASKGKFKTDSIKKTHDDVCSLCPLMLRIEKQYPLGTLNLRNLQIQIDKLWQPFQLSNDINHELDRKEMEERLENNLMDLLKNNGVTKMPKISKVQRYDDVLGKKLGGPNPAYDHKPGELFLDALARRANPAAVKLEELMRKRKRKAPAILPLSGHIAL
jgi:hypothetical protein